MMLSKKRVSGANASGKKFTVELNIDIKELEQALDKHVLSDAFEKTEQVEDSVLDIPCRKLLDSPDAPGKPIRALCKDAEAILFVNVASR